MGLEGNRFGVGTIILTLIRHNEGHESTKQQKRGLRPAIILLFIYDPSVHICKMYTSYT